MIFLKRIIGKIEETLTIPCRQQSKSNNQSATDILTFLVASSILLLVVVCQMQRTPLIAMGKVKTEVSHTKLFNSSSLAKFHKRKTIQASNRARAKVTTTFECFKVLRSHLHVQVSSSKYLPFS